MRKQIQILAISIISSISCYSQIVFENGYFINETDQKIDCLIKNIDWRKNPTVFEYKLFQNTEIKKAGIHEVKEFGIFEASKYIRSVVEMDRSSSNLPDISTERSPVFREEQLFLKVVVEGKASLLQYRDRNLTRFFIKTNDNDIKQLVYKIYLKNGESVARNVNFRQQLLLGLKCKDITSNDLKYLEYTIRDLEQIFVKYNECINSDYVNFEAKKNKDFFNLTIKPGINISNLTIFDSDSDSEFLLTDFSTSFNFKFGVETELTLPFNKNKWAILIEPTYQYFKSEKTTETSTVSGGIVVASVDYKSIELHVGIRHYFYLNNESNIFVNASCIFDFSPNSSIDFIRSDGSQHSSWEITSRNNLAFGFGYKYKDKYSLETRYQTGREVLGDYVNLNSYYRTLSIIFGYSLF